MQDTRSSARKPTVQTEAFGDDPSRAATAFDAQLDAFADRNAPRHRRRAVALAEAGAIRLEAVWSGLADYVRRQGAALGKRVELVSTGGELEVSGQAGEALRPALLQLIRNACVHRVETPAARQGAGKPGLAILRLSARRSGDRVMVVLADDGRGLVAGREERSPAFLPAESLDAAAAEPPPRAELELVRGAVEEAGGDMAMSSTPGRGAAFTLTLPGPAKSRPRPLDARPAA